LLNCVLGSTCLGCNSESQDGKPNYAASYIQHFLVSVRQQLLACLCAPEKPLRPEAENMAEQTVRSLDEALRQVAKGAGKR
jgi:hypothetical protein